MSEAEAGRISTMEQLEARLEKMRQAGGDPAAYEEAVRSLASSLDRPLRSGALLKVARVGAESYPAFRVVPSAVPPVFEGRPAAELPAVQPTTRTDGPRREPLPEESVGDYGRYLIKHLTHWVTDQEVDISEDDLSVAASYASALAREDFRQVVGWARSLDAHAVMMLLFEYAFRHAGGLELPAPVEEAFFRWLHLASYEEVTPEHLREVAARRDIRRSHQEQPAREVAVMVCETPLVDPFPFDELTDQLHTGLPLTAEQIREFFQEVAGRGGDHAERWTARARGFEDTGELDLTPRTGNSEAELEAYAAGHLLRWMLDRDVPVGPFELAAWGKYAAEAADTMVFGPARHGREKLQAATAHHVARHLLRKIENCTLTLAEELCLLAWLTAQTRVAIRLAAWLEQRDEWLARL